MEDVLRSPWWSVGGSLLAGLFVAYLDRTNLSVSITQVSQDMGFTGDRFAVTSSWALTTFLIGYALANIFGGFVTRKLDPKPVVIFCFALWSAGTILVGFTSSVAVLLACRLVLGMAEGVYWPQQSRFARAWFAPQERTKANGIIQFYGQFLALALGFVILTPLYDAFGWRVLFFLTGGVGLVVIVPLYLVMLRPEREAPYLAVPTAHDATPLTLAAFGGPPFLLLVVSYLTQGMLFWGITLWVPLAVRSLGFTGFSQAVASSMPFLAAVLLAIPMGILSDRSQKRVLIAALGQILPGCLLLLLPTIDSAGLKLALITVALGYYASSYTPNIWSILQGTVEPRAVGPASGIINGIGAGGGGTIAGFLVAIINSYTGSYMVAFTALGGIVIVGGVCLLAYGQLTARKAMITAEVPA